MGRPHLKFWGDRTPVPPRSPPLPLLYIIDAYVTMFSIIGPINVLAIGYCMWRIVVMRIVVPHFFLQ